MKRSRGRAAPGRNMFLSVPNSSYYKSGAKVVKLPRDSVGSLAAQRHHGIYARRAGMLAARSAVGQSIAVTATKVCDMIVLSAAERQE